MSETQKSLSKTAKHLKLTPKSDNTFSNSKPGNQVNSFQCITQCLLHISQYITHFCENCQYKPLCGLCLQEGTHKNHSVKNVEKTGKIVHRILTQTLISIRAKVNLLQILDEHVATRQNQIRQQLKDYIDNINNCFDDLQNCIEEKKKQLTKTIQQFYKASAEKLIEAQKCVKEEINKLQEMIKVLSSKTDRLDSNSLCLFYYQKKDILQGIMEQGNSLYQDLKKLATQLKWVVNPEVFQPIKTQIAALTLKSTSTQIQLINSKIIQTKKKSTPKGKQKHIRQTSQKKANINTTGFWTPKHLESPKQLPAYFRMAEKLSKQLKQSYKLLTLASSQSMQKTNQQKVIDPPPLLLKKTKNKPKFDKNN